LSKNMWSDMSIQYLGDKFVEGHVE
jgi:hypothetical protein